MEKPWKKENAAKKPTLFREGQISKTENPLQQRFSRSDTQ
jgi:hypothetical protein